MSNHDNFSAINISGKRADTTSKTNRKASETTARTNRSNLKNFVAISAGCALFTQLADGQISLASNCVEIDSNTPISQCNKAAQSETDNKAIETNNQPTVEQNTSIRWSSQTRQNLNSGNLNQENFHDTIAPLNINPSNITSNQIENTFHRQVDAEHSVLGDAQPLLLVSDTGDSSTPDTTEFKQESQQSSERIEQVDSSSNQESDPNLDISPVSPSNNSIINRATASSYETGERADEATVPISGSPGIGINKAIVEVINPDGSIDSRNIIDQAGDTIDYAITVTNAGNVTLTGIQISDPILGGDLVLNGSLEPGASRTLRDSYIVKQSDIDTNGSGNGYIDNEVTVSSNQTNPKMDAESVPIQQRPALKVDKQAIEVDILNDGVMNQVGDIVRYVITIQNTGNQTLTNISIDDPLLANEVIPQLAPGETRTLTVDYPLTQADIDNNGVGDGDIDNIVTVNSDQTEPAQSFAEVPIEQNPNLNIEKRVLSVDADGDGVLNQAGEMIEYELIVTNTGNQTLIDVLVRDPIANVDQRVTLAPGQQQIIPGKYTLTQANLDNGF